jgi:hypothetical protein
MWIDICRIGNAGITFRAALWHQPGLVGRSNPTAKQASGEKPCIDSSVVRPRTAQTLAVIEHDLSCSQKASG